MMSELSMGVAGVGAIGRNHARVLASLPGVKLAGADAADALAVAIAHAHLAGALR